MTHRYLKFSDCYTVFSQTDVHQNETFVSTNLFFSNRTRAHGVRDREPIRTPKKRIKRIVKKCRKVKRLLRTYITKSIPKSSRMHLFTNKAREKIYAHGIRCENKGTMKYPSSAVRRKYPKSKKHKILKM